MISSDTFVCQTSFHVSCPDGQDYSSVQEKINLTDRSFGDNLFPAENRTLEFDDTSSKSASASDDNSIDDDDQVCHPNIVAVCQTKPEVVTVTEQRQLCKTGPRPRTRTGSRPGSRTERPESSDSNPVTTKICITYKDGSWFCRNLVSGTERSVIAIGVLIPKMKMAIMA